MNAVLGTLKYAFLYVLCIAAIIAGLALLALILTTPWAAIALSVFIVLYRGYEEYKENRSKG